MNPRYAELVRRLAEAVAGPGVTDPSLREAVREYAARLAGPPPVQLPPALQGYIEKVARHAHTVSDADVAALRRAGVSEDTLFELTVSAAFGAGVGRLDRGLAALRGEI